MFCHISSLSILILFGYLAGLGFSKGSWYTNEALWDHQWKTDQWGYLERATVEVSRTAVIGAVLIQKYAPSGLILDVGCGTGVLSDFLTHEQKKNYIGIDFSKEAVAIATKSRNLTFIHTKAEDYVPPKDKFACVAFNEVLYYVDFQKTLDKYSKLLKDDGIIIISKYHDITRNGKAVTQDPTLKYARSVFNLIDDLQLSGSTPGNDNVTSKVVFRMEVFKVKI